MVGKLELFTVSDTVRALNYERYNTIEYERGKFLNIQLFLRSEKDHEHVRIQFRLLEETCLGSA